MNGADECQVQWLLRDSALTKMAIKARVAAKQAILAISLHFRHKDGRRNLALGHKMRKLEVKTR